MYVDSVSGLFDENVELVGLCNKVKYMQASDMLNFSSMFGSRSFSYAADAAELDIDIIILIILIN